MYNVSLLGGTMITARNYAAQAENDLRKAAKEFASVNDADRASAMLHTANKIKKAVHFSMPDNAEILNDGFKGIRGEEIHLPYKLITVEFFFRDGLLSQNTSTKYIVIAEEFDEHINILTCQFVHDVNKWGVQNMFIQVPIRWDADSVQDNKVHKYKCLAYPLLDDMDAKSMEAEAQWATVTSSSVLELIEALSCSNVTHEPIEKINPAVNARRIRDGKLPLYETRCLVINAGKSVGVGNGIGGTHGSPRQHLRRGHIRRHPTAGNIWVNSCVVGSSELGVIEKQYAVC